MNDLLIPRSAPETPPRRGGVARHWKWVALALFGIAAVYLVLAYVVMPMVWIRYAQRHPALDQHSEAGAEDGNPQHLAKSRGDAAIRDIERAIDAHRE